jgi:hypothetical protein
MEFIGKYLKYVMKHIPYGIHMDSMDSTWNISIPYGFHMECGGVVKYWPLTIYLILDQPKFRFSDPLTIHLILEQLNFAFLSPSQFP